MPVVFNAKPVEGLVEVTKTGVDGKETSEKIPIGTVATAKPTANVGFLASYTKNLGNYESLKVQVSLNLPVEIDTSSPEEDLEENISNGFLFVSQWVDARLQHVLKEFEENK